MSVKQISLQVDAKCAGGAGRCLRRAVVLAGIVLQNRRQKKSPRWGSAGLNTWSCDDHTGHGVKKPLRQNEKARRLAGLLRTAFGRYSAGGRLRFVAFFFLGGGAGGAKGMSTELTPKYSIIGFVRFRIYGYSREPSS